MTERVDITLTINGRDHSVRVEPRKTLADVIRDECGQTGTHIGCEHGVCGACTVILDSEAVRSCLMFAVQAQGRRIRTVEGLADGDKLHPLQNAFIAHHALQCGFCTPGFLMLAVNALETNPDITDEEILEVLSSNLCRCTGYQNIIKAVRSTAAEMRARRPALIGRRGYRIRIQLRRSLAIAAIVSVSYEGAMRSSYEYFQRLAHVCSAASLLLCGASAAGRALSPRPLPADRDTAANLTRHDRCG